MVLILCTMVVGIIGAYFGVLANMFESRFNRV